MDESNSHIGSCLQDPRLFEAHDFFNSRKWYEAHDLFEELWHETIGPERRTLQGFLQVAVAQVHLERGNINGATLLFGEGLGRLREKGTPDLGFDLHLLCECVESLLSSLQHKYDPDPFLLPSLVIKE